MPGRFNSKSTTNTEILQRFSIAIYLLPRQHGGPLAIRPVRDCKKSKKIGACSRKINMKTQKKVPQALAVVSIVLLWGMLGCGGGSTVTPAATPTPTASPTPTPAPTPTVESWKQLRTNVPPAARDSPSGIFDAANNRLTVFGGRNASDTANLNDAWVLANANGNTGTGVWTLLTAGGAAGSPPVRWGAASAYDSANNRLMIFGGCAAGCLPALNDVWVLTNANGLGGVPAWVQLAPTGTPPTARTKSTSVYDAASNRLIVFAGQDGSGNGCSTFSDTWVLSNANGLGGTPAWTQLSPTGGPPLGQYGAAAVYDSANNRMVISGGSATVGGVCSFSTATWVLTNANGLGGTPAWTNTVSEGTANAPPPRTFFSAVYDSAVNQMIIFGGNNGQRVTFGDSWALSNANGVGGVSTWTQLTTSGGPPTRTGHVAGFDPVAHVMMVFGGDEGTVLSDTWVLTNVK